MYDDKDKPFTEQGRDTPVPVGARSSRAGSPRPSSSDREEQLELKSGGPENPPAVENPAQKGGEYDPITKKPENPFGKKPLLIRSPVRGRAGSFSGPLSTKQEEEGAKGKRKRLAIGAGEEESGSVESLTLKKMSENINTLQKLVKANPNTKLEIKRGIEEAAWLVRKLYREWEVIQFEKTNRAEHENVQKVDRDTQTAMPEEQRKQGGQPRDILGEIEKVDGFESFEKIARARWPNEAFRLTECAEGNPVRGAITEDLALVTHENNLENEKGIGRTLLERFPELATAAEADGEEGETYSIRTLSIKMGHRNRDGSETNFEKRVFRLWTQRENEGRENAKRLYNLFTELRNRQDESRTRRILMPAPEGLGLVVTRKMLECVFFGTGTSFTVYGPKKTTERAPGAPKSTKRNVAETITLTAEGTTYAELLRRIKTDVDTKEVGATILGVRKTDGEKMQIITRGSQKEIEKLKDKIKDNMTGVQVKHRARRKGVLIHVRDIDAITTSEEVERAFQEALQEGEESSDVRVLSIRPSQGETQTATVQVPAETATRLARTGRPRIGMVMCRTRLRVEVTSCYRCWEVGHLARNCEGTDRSGHCRRCGGEGHVASDCRNDPHCPLCARRGHRAGNTGCPKFRNALNKARETEIPGRRGSEASQWIH